MSEPNELRWHPDCEDQAFGAGYEFVERHRETGDGFHGKAPWWYGWMVRQAFWCGVKWARERNSTPVLGKIVDDGRIEWNGGDGP